MKKTKKVKMKFIYFFLSLLIGIGFLISYFTGDVSKDIKLGLDLQGGFEVLYEVKPIKEGQVINQEVLSSTVEALRNRIDVLGVSEPSIQIEGEDRIRVQLAGIDDQNKAREILSTQAKLTFRDVNDQLLLDGSDLKEGGASVTFSETNSPWVSIKLKDAKLFKEATEKTLGSALVIWLDYKEGDTFANEMQKEKSKIISAPSVSEVLNTTDVVIQGQFQLEEAQQLADLLNAGSLPVDLQEVYSTSVSAQFGEKALQDTILAGIIGILAIFMFMVAVYRFPGIIAVITLSFYIFLNLVIFDWMNAVLTLPGIAALILGVGMAVDANILTYERIKEEIKTGRSLQAAFKAGSQRSLSTILDANLTTLLSAGVLFAYGTSSVKGFAVMLIMGILISFVTAVFGSRLLLGLWVKSGFLNKKPHWFGVKESDINEL